MFHKSKGIRNAKKKKKIQNKKQLEKQLKNKE